MMLLSFQKFFDSGTSTIHYLEINEIEMRTNVSDKGTIIGNYEKRWNLNYYKIEKGN